MSNELLKILSDLVSFKTITPNGEEAIDYASGILSEIGFCCQKYIFDGVTNLYAKYGDSDKNICFAGHIDVVPPMDGWKTDPFSLEIIDNVLYGRGVNDMKGPLVSAIIAIKEFIKTKNPDFSISVMLTSDEEIMGDNGTKKLVEYLLSKNEKISLCILCESCSANESGEYIKIGCKGSLNVDLISTGDQCHVVNGKKYKNHLHRFISFLNEFILKQLDSGNDFFDPSDIEITSIDTNNNVRNIIPSKITAKLNVRFNNEWTFESLEKHIKTKLPKNIDCIFERFGTPFVGCSQDLINSLSKTLERINGTIPSIGTSGGNSDAVSIRNITQVVEIGSKIDGAHKVNESIEVEELYKLKDIYYAILKDSEHYKY